MPVWVRFKQGFVLGEKRETVLTYKNLDNGD